MKGLDFVTLQVAASQAHLKAVWCGVIWRVNDPSTVDEAVQRFLSAFEFLSTFLD